MILPSVDFATTETLLHPVTKKTRNVPMSPGRVALMRCGLQPIREGEFAMLEREWPEMHAFLVGT